VTKRNRESFPRLGSSGYDYQDESSPLHSDFNSRDNSSHSVRSPTSRRPGDTSFDLYTLDTMGRLFGAPDVGAQLAVAARPTVPIVQFNRDTLKTVETLLSLSKHSKEMVSSLLRFQSNLVHDMILKDGFQN
jgi:hypothetical protein